MRNTEEEEEKLTSSFVVISVNIIIMELQGLWQAWKVNALILTLCIAPTPFYVWRSFLCVTYCFVL